MLKTAFIKATDEFNGLFENQVPAPYIRKAFTAEQADTAAIT